MAQQVKVLGCVESWLLRGFEVILSSGNVDSPLGGTSRPWKGEIVMADGKAKSLSSLNAQIQPQYLNH
jgi:hypothetical protein